LQGFKGCCKCGLENKREYNHVGQAGGQERAKCMVCQDPCEGLYARD